MGTLLRDDFTGSGAWSASSWPFAQYQSDTQPPTRTQVAGMGVTTSQPVDYKYGRFYFGVPARANVGVRVAGRFDASGSAASLRFLLRAGRAGRANLDFTYAANCYSASLNRDNAQVSIDKVVSDSLTSLTTLTLPFTPGTQNWLLRFEAEGAQLRFKAWLASGSEPTSWTRTLTDASLSSGEVAWSTGYNANQVTRFDYFEATDLAKNLALAGSSTGAGWVRKSTYRIFTSRATAVGTALLTRTIPRTFAGAATAVGTMRRATVRLFVGAATGQGTLRRSGFTKRLAGSSTGSARLRFSPRKLLAGSATGRGETGTRSLGRIFGRPAVVIVKVRSSAQALLRARRG